MSYISAKRLKGNVVVWERNNNQERVVKEYKTPWYYYTEAKQGEYVSLFGKPLMLHEFSSKRNYDDSLTAAKYNKSYGQLIYESDIQPEAKILSKHYYNVPAPQLHVTFLDIEVDYDERLGFSSIENPYAPINSVSFHHQHTDETIVFAVPPEGWEGEIDQEVQDLADVYLCKNEKELLQRFYAEIEDSDCLTGWNCIPVTQHIWSNNEIIPVSEVNGTLYDSTVVRSSPVTSKIKYVTELSNGVRIESSKDHRFPVIVIQSIGYCNSYSTLTVEEIQNSSDVIYVETLIRNNTNDDNNKYENNLLYNVGLKYNEQPTSWCLTEEYRDLIYHDHGTPRLNLRLLSSLSRTQFMSLLAGLLDGNGYTSDNGYIEYCDYINSDDIQTLYDLCTWNGIVCVIFDNMIQLSVVDLADLPLRCESKWIGVGNGRETDSHNLPHLTHIYTDEKIYIKVTGVSSTGEYVDMMDIETDTHYFRMNGIKTHNSDFFDLPYIFKRTEIVLGPKWSRLLSFNVPDFYQPGKATRDFPDPYDCMKPNLRDVNTGFNISTTVDFIGRIKLDYLWLFKKYEMAGRPSYKLASIAEAEVPHLPKLTYTGNLHRLYREDFSFFIRYNIRDTEILKELEKKLGYVALANEMYHLSCGESRDVTGTIQLADKAAVNYCHEVLNVIVPDRREIQDGGDIKGAVVLDPNKGLHKYVASIDINSLYPSAIRSINISPEQIIGQFTGNVSDWEKVWAEDDIDPIFLETEDGNHISKTGKEWKTELKRNQWAMSGYGTVFDQSSGKGFIPAILEDWYATRKVFQAKKGAALDAGDKQLAAYYDRLQYVYKIKLNSFYGALTNQFFRFYDLRMGESTTGTGRAILMHQCAKVSELLDGTYNPRGESVLYGDSVAGDTKITTPQFGDTNIAELFTTVDYIENGKEYCNLSDVDTLTYDELDDVTTFQPIKYVVRHKVEKQMYRVWISNVRYIDVTEDHSLIGFVNSPNRRDGKILTNIKATEIGNVTNSLIIPRRIPRTNIAPKNLHINLYELMGYVIGSGHVERNIQSGVSISIDDDDLTEINSVLFVPLIDAGWVKCVHILPNGHGVYLSGSKLGRLLNDLLYVDGVKQFPAFIASESTENIRAFLRGYFSADGFANEMNTIGLCSENLDWIKQAHHLLLLCGIPSNYFTETTENSFNGKYSGTHNSTLNVYDAVEFGNVIGFLLKRKNDNIPTTREAKKHHLTSYDFAICTPTKIEKIEYNDYVYDIEVEKTHIFFANGILAHNTDSTYFSTGTDNDEDAVRVGDDISNTVSDSFPEFMQDRFCCTDSFKMLIKAGREVIADAAIFVEKKRYIMHVFDNEGEKCDKIKAMGLDLKKTTTPKLIQDMLIKTVRMILNEEDDDIINDYIIDCRDEIELNMNFFDIGLPKGVNKVDEYTEAYKLDDTTRLPGHVAAALHYNICLKEYNDRESIELKSGMKLKVFYIKNNRYTRFKSIALPTDTITIPEWFTQLYEDEIDKTAHSSRLLDNNLANIFKAIDREVPTKDTRDAHDAWEW